MNVLATYVKCHTYNTQLYTYTHKCTYMYIKYICTCICIYTCTSSISLLVFYYIQIVYVVMYIHELLIQCSSRSVCVCISSGIIMSTKRKLTRNIKVCTYYLHTLLLPHLQYTYSTLLDITHIMHTIMTLHNNSSS